MVGTYVEIGCYSELQNARLLTGTSPAANPTNMTVEYCVNGCKALNKVYAGVEFGTECYCSDILPLIAISVDRVQCNIVCSGNNKQFCGGRSVLNIYRRQ